MTHEHDFLKDLDGQVTCTQCGAINDEKPSPTIQAIEKELTPLPKSQVRRITKVKSDELREAELLKIPLEACTTEEQ